MAASGTFSQTISLEGADDVRAKLQQIGAAGEKAFAQLGQAAGAANLRNVSRNMDAVKTSATSMANGLQDAIGSIGTFGGALTLVAGRAGPLGLALAGVGTAFIALSRSAVDSVTATARTAESLGLTIAQYRGLSKAAREAGVDQDTLTSALRRFANFASEGAREQFKSIAEIAKQLPSGKDFFPFLNDVPGQLRQTEQLRRGIESVAKVIQQQFADIGRSVSLGQIQGEINNLIQGTSEAAAKARELLRQAGASVPGISSLEKLDQLVRKNAGDFESLGVSLLDARGKAISTADAIGRFADAIAKLPDGFEKTALVQRIFGREASLLIPLLNRGAAGAQQFIAAFEQLGPVFEQQRQEALRASIAFGEIDASFSRFKNTVGVGLAPGIIDFFNRLTQAIDFLKQKTGDGSFLGNLLQGIANSGANITREFDTLGQAAQRAWELIKPTTLIDAVNTVIIEIGKLQSKAEEAWEALKRLFTPTPSSPGSDGFGAGPGDQTGFRRGGFVRGPGTGTSDSILAWLSNGEFVIRADGSNLIDALRHFGRGFAMGGLVDGLSRSLSIPRFAMGGPVLSGSLGHMDVDLRTNHGTFRLQASREVASAMASAARDSADAQTGQRPSWYRGR